MRIFSILCILITLAACSAPQVARYTPPSFTQYAPFNMDVAAVNVTDEYKSSSQEPHVELTFPTPPAEAMRIWVRDRIHATGGGKTLTVLIKDAGVTETRVPAQSSAGSLIHDQNRRYDARLEVEMRIYAENQAMSEASIHVAATRTDMLPASASAAEREKLFDNMTRDLMASMNGELEKNFYRYFNNYIRY